MTDDPLSDVAAHARLILQRIVDQFAEPRWVRVLSQTPALRRSHRSPRWTNLISNLPVGEIPEETLAKLKQPAPGEVADWNDFESGRLMFLQARDDAKRALMQEDPALLCIMAYEVQSLLIGALAVNPGFVVAERRRTAGKKTAEKNREKALKPMKPWIAKYRELRRAGKDEESAYLATIRLMEKKEFVLPLTDEFPSERTLKKYLRD